MQGHRPDRAMLALMAVQPKQFPCSLDPSPPSSSDASAEAGSSDSRQLGELSAFQLLYTAEALHIYQCCLEVVREGILQTDLLPAGMVKVLLLMQPYAAHAGPRSSTICCMDGCGA